MSSTSSVLSRDQQKSRSLRELSSSGSSSLQKPTHKRGSSLNLEPSLKPSSYGTDSSSMIQSNSRHKRVSSLQFAPAPNSSRGGSSSLRSFKNNSYRKPPTYHHHKRGASLQDNYQPPHQQRRNSRSHSYDQRSFSPPTRQKQRPKERFKSYGSLPQSSSSHSHQQSSEEKEELLSLMNQPPPSPTMIKIPSSPVLRILSEDHYYQEEGKQDPIQTNRSQHIQQIEPLICDPTTDADIGEETTHSSLPNKHSSKDGYFQNTSNTYDSDVMSYLTSGKPIIKHASNQASNLESFDYDAFESLIHQQYELQKTLNSIKTIDLGRWIMCFWIGVCTALVACFIEFFCKIFSSFRTNAMQLAIDTMRLQQADQISSEISQSKLIAQYFLEFFDVNGYTMYILISCGYVFIATYLVAIICPISGGSGIPEIKATLNGIKIHRVAQIQTLFCKVIGVLFSVSGGLPVGKEGPMVHSGSIVGAILSQGHWSNFGLDISCAQLKAFRNDKEKRDFISCGAAAGVAAAFGAPIGGVLFVLEEGASFWHQHLTWRTYFCAMVSAFTLHMVATFSESDKDMGIMGTQGGTFSFGQFDGSKHYAVWEVTLFIIIGMLGGLFGALFNGANTKITLFRMKYVTNRWLKLLEALFVAFCMATVSFWFSYFFGTCLPKSGPFPEDLVTFHCEENEYNDLASLYTVSYGTTIKQLFHFTDDTKQHDVSFTPLSLIMLFISYYVMATWTYGISVPSGLFVPSLLAGAAFGRICVYFLHFLDVDTVAPDGMFALIGAAAMLGGQARMTISLTVILLECTGVIEWGLPVMVTLMAARWVGNSFNEGLYDIHIHLKKLPFLEFDPPFYSRYLRVQHIMSTNPITLNSVVRVGEVYHVLKTFEHSCFPVMEDDVQHDLPSAKFVGIMLRKHLCVLLKKKDFLIDRPVPYARKPTDGNTTVLHNQLYALNHDDIESAYPRYPNINEIKLSFEEKQLWMDLTPYMNATPLFVKEQTPVTRVYSLFRSLGLRHLMVLNHNYELSGIVSRKDLTKQYMVKATNSLTDDEKDQISGYNPSTKNNSHQNNHLISSTDSSSEAGDQNIMDYDHYQGYSNNTAQPPLSPIPVSPVYPYFPYSNDQEYDNIQQQAPQAEYFNRKRSGTDYSDITEFTSYLDNEGV